MRQTHRLNQNRWLLPLCWCSSDSIIRTVCTLSGLCNPETTFLTPFVDFLWGDWHISDYIIRKMYKLLDYVIWIHPLHLGINIHQADLSVKIHEFVRNLFSEGSSNYVIRTRDIFRKKNRARENSTGWKK